MVENKKHTSGQWLVIVNPNAGSRKGEKDWHKISHMLKDAGIKFREVFTKHKEHATAIVSETIKTGTRSFIVVGGDGTLNEVVNGIFNQHNVLTTQFLVAMIPVGTGNDWCRMFGIPFNYNEAVNIIKTHNTFLTDIGLVSYLSTNKNARRYFINVAGMGYDAVVAAKTNHDKEMGRGGVLIYLKNLFISLLFYKHTQINLQIDNAPALSHKTFSISIGICKFNGGGMKQLPHAIPDDGIFNITLIKKLRKFTVLKQVKNLYDGSFINHPKVKTFTGSHIKISSTPPIQLEADGESLGHSPFEFSILPKSLYVVMGHNPSF